MYMYTCSYSFNIFLCIKKLIHMKVNTQSLYFVKSYKVCTFEEFYSLLKIKIKSPSTKGFWKRI